MKVFGENGEEQEAKDEIITEPSSIFNRPGFGSVAFRNSISAFNAMSMFLAAIGLHDWAPKFIRERIDLEALMLLSENDLGEVLRLVVTMLMTSAYKS